MNRLLEITNIIEIKIVNGLLKQEIRLSKKRINELEVRWEKTI